MDKGMQLSELREIAKERGLKNISKLRKDELIELLNNLEIEESQKKTKEPEKVENVRKEEQNSQENQATSGGYKVTNETDDIVEGILEVLPDGYGFLRGDNYLSSNKDVYISPIQIKRFRLNTGDKIKGIARFPKEGEKFPALIFVGDVNRRFS